MSDENAFSPKTALIGAQMLFVAFGALVLVPLLTGLDSNVALFTAGVGTLIFQLITKRSIPIFLASSFAFIAPIIYGIQTWGIASTMGGLMAAGCVYILLSGIVAWRGTEIIERVLPPIVVGPVIVVIGLSLAPVAVNMALGKTGDGSAELVNQSTAILISMSALLVTAIASLLGSGIIRLIPILLGVSVGYVVALLCGIVSFDPISNAAWFTIPSFTLPEFNASAILFMLPVAIAPAVEHIGDMMAISSVTKKDFLKKPGLHKTLLGDGVATTAAAVVGGPPNTTYSEVSGAVALTKAFNPIYMTWAAVFAIILSFCGKLGGFLATIPTPVMGGIMVLLFGAIATIGIGTIARSNADLHDPRNLAIISIPLVFGIGGMNFGGEGFVVQGIGLAAISGILLNLVLPKTKPETEQ
ncbi:uracil permease [Oleiphilus sp. HI0125]|uniref:uracil-xanthine permease family protein n=2 Tax=Oleiphilus sp. HI0125 TaxID=1822266 RepID=UPI0007C338D7|nr:uracil-xanthine permease family protein [Oleiphilus sp. HI0125]KZZ59291.1 uracil permease [Oleiphilus sp. HI0125]